MASKALDLVTMGHALDTLEQAFPQGCAWWGATTDQQMFLKWWLTNRHNIPMLSGLEALASREASVLNDFLVKRGFEPQFDPFDPEGFGAVSILDMLVKWLQPAAQATIGTRADRGWVNFPAFQIPKNGAIIHRAEGFTSPLVELLTESGDSLWLMMLDEPWNGLELAMTADRLFDQPLQPDNTWSGVVVPKIELQIEPDLSWMLGVYFEALPDDYFRIVQAFQQFKFRMNEEGARAKVATGFSATRGISLAPQPLRIDRPFIGFFTQKGLPLPIAAFYADYDCWGEPDGSLGEL